LRFISNTSTGMCQVTNALLDMLISTNGTKLFSAMLESTEEKLNEVGGSTSSLRVWCLGEALMAYVIKKTGSI
ncbi:MAG: hypothetical protein NT157_03010, partial [Candidatus Micrarchaeota archaeon]|nr:hypothetical protein [Candidatus Micrarchaeota archaeon]